MATNRFVCEICNKGFQRDQNLQLHRRGHNLPWKLKQRTSAEIKKRVYICPETTCVHHNPARALGDLTGIKKHFCRKHGEKKYKCEKCSKKYAVQSDWKAHSKTCGTREYKCDCGTIFSRRDSFITHRAFCDALTEENNKVNQGLISTIGGRGGQGSDLIMSPSMPSEFNHTSDIGTKSNLPQDLMPMPLIKSLNMSSGMFSTNSGTLIGGGRTSISSASSCLQLSANTTSFDGIHDSKFNRQLSAGSAHMSATALLQKAAQMGATASSNINSPMMQKSFMSGITNSYDHVQSHPDQSQLVGMDGTGGFNINQFLHKSPQEMSSQFNDSPGMTDMGMFFMGSSGGGGGTSNGTDQQHHENGGPMLLPRSSSLGSGMGGRSPLGPSRFSSTGNNNVNSGDMLTVDFLGVGGPRPASLHEQHNHHQQGLEFEGLNQQRMQGLLPFQQQISHGQGAMGEKPLWDV
ncbi:hypothetical protein GIB67_015169 [Kingdonia uniflora]|uniref:C2H2-type domain-containing protein n=1 Tax=Kingdonia uniflora TaxID=39325 RepID=A0A7J7LJ77_9MAGN|nr:hypothetical protein GIB67_015169 [Kingdonia uniflora]